jgi:hypothetical protein
VGPYAVTEQSYDFGNAAYVPPQFGLPTSSNKIELTGEIYSPTDLSAGPFPLVVLMHGNHVDEYTTAGGTGYAWPIQTGFQALPNYLGYGYFADTLASHGYIVVSISANGVNVLGNSFAGTGMLGRGQLIERTLDIFSDLNADGVVHTRPGDTSNFVDGQMPFGTQFVGKVDMQNVGLMGHSRGGEGAVQGYLVNGAAGSPYNIKAVFAIAPVDFQSPTINNTNFAVLLPYNDGDVSDLQGAHFFDDSRYNVAGDTGAKYTIEVMGANHNFYNTVWSPGGGYPGGVDEGNSGPPTRLTQAQQRGTGLAYMSAFFRTYLGGELQFQPILTGDAPPPPSAQVTPDRIHIGYLPPDNSVQRRDVNRLTAATALSVNTLGGTVVPGGLASYTFTTGGGAGFSEPHRNLGQVTIGYTGTLTAYWENDLPAAARDESAYTDLQFRIGVNYGDARNPPNTAQDFSIELDDGSGQSHSVLVSAYSNNLFDPPTPAGNPHEVLNTVRIPLSAFVGSVDLTNVIAIRFDFDQHNSGAFQITDLAFTADQANGPYVVSSTPNGNVAPAVDHVRMTFNRSMDPTTFTADHISLTAPDGSTIDAAGVAVPMTNNTQFDITFDPQGLAGHYTLVLTGITDADGNPLATYTAGFTITSPSVIATTPGAGAVSAPFNLVHVTFDRSMDPTTVTSDNITLTGPSGDIPVMITATSPDNTQFDVTFDDQTAAGGYTLAIGTGVQDTYTNPLTGFTGQFNILPTGTNLVTNGGFENPIGSEWTIVDPTGFTRRGTAHTHTGSFALELGATGADGTATQTLATAAGQSYTFSFWYYRDGATPSDLHVFWNGMDIYDEVNSAAHDFVQHTFTVMATGTSTQIRFAARNDPGFDYLDDVSVIAN